MSSRLRIAVMPVMKLPVATAETPRSNRLTETFGYPGPGGSHLSAAKRDSGGIHRCARGSRGAPATPGRDPRFGHRKERLMALILLVLLLALLLGGLGFVLHVLWWIALVVIVLWLLGFLVRAGEGTSRSRWYRW
jgi:hypothetical protein